MRCVYLEMFCQRGKNELVEQLSAFPRGGLNHVSGKMLLPKQTSGRMNDYVNCVESPALHLHGSEKMPHHREYHSFPTRNNCVH